MNMIKCALQYKGYLQDRISIKYLQDKIIINNVNNKPS
jgi:hypothetical protein